MMTEVVEDIFLLAVKGEVFSRWATKALWCHSYVLVVVERKCFDLKREVLLN